MRNKASRFIAGTVMAGSVGWALAGAVSLGCDWTARSRTSNHACGVPEGGGWYFAVLFIMPVLALLLVSFGKPIIRTDDWRPSLGISAGCAVGIVFALAKDPMPQRIWIAVAVLAVIAMAIPLGLWSRERALRGSS